MLTVTKSIFVDKADFSPDVKKGFFGIMPGQPVCLRYGPFVKMEDVVTNAAGDVVKVRVRAIPQPAEKVKGVIHWVSKNNSIPAIVNQYSNLLTVENVGE